MRLGSPLPTRKARIEIIPLIDVMFFLLASFMMVSLGMQRLRTLKMDLPSAVKAAAGEKPRLTEVRVEANGDIRIEGTALSLPEFVSRIREQARVDAARPVYIRPHPDASHGDVLRVLDSARLAGASRVSIELLGQGGPDGGAVQRVP